MSGDAEIARCCPNCGQTHGAISACALGVFIGVVEDRGEVALDSITPEIVAGMEVDELWGRFGGPAVDWLEGQLLELGAKEVGGK